jgi:hypothetical protein
MGRVIGTAMQALFVSAVLLAGYQEAPERGSIRGRVTRAGTTEPLTKAFVELIDADAGPADGLHYLNARRTGDSGEFSFTEIPPGRYRLSVTRDSYSRTEYLQRGSNARGAVLTVGSGQQVDDVLIEMIPAGTVAGAVRDETGGPLAGITISAYVLQHLPGGEVRLRVVQSEETNDLGEYRLYWLSPGEYYIAAHDGGGLNQTTPGRQNAVEPDVSYPAYYFPDTLDPGVAQSVQVREGIVVEAIDFVLKQVRLPSVRGRVDSAESMPRRVALLPALLSEASSELSASGVLSDGRFEIANVPAGRYLLSAGQSVTPIDVGATDVDGLHIALAPAVPVQGRIRTESGDAFSSNWGLSLWFLGRHARRDGFPAQIGEDGTFTARGWPGEFEISITDLPSGYFLKEATAMGRNAAEKGLSIPDTSASPIEVDVVLGRNESVLTGAVTDSDQRPVAGARIVLVPAGNRRRFDPYPQTTTDTAGQYELRALPPGDYTAYVFEDAADDAYYDPGFLRERTGTGASVAIAQNADATVNLKLIPRVTP